MRAWLIGIFARGVLVYDVMQAQSPGSTTASHGAAKTAPAQAVTRGNGTPGNVTQARVLAEASRGDSWLVNGGNFESQHFTPLKSITDRNVGRLALAWAVDVPSPMGLSAEPIVVDGVVYLGAPFDKVFAIDAATGKLRWQFDPHIRINGPWRNSYEGRKNRGVAVWNGKVYGIVYRLCGVDYEGLSHPQRQALAHHDRPATRRAMTRRSSPERPCCACSRNNAAAVQTRSRVRGSSEPCDLG